MESYNLMTTHNEKLRTVDNMTGHLLLVVTDDPKYWPYQYVESQRLIFEKIFEDLKSQAESEEEYQKIYWRVAAVYFENMYMQMQFH
ncbi:MAG: hypothetical protein IJV99_01935, partial [Clostridia bacterium]|nr:hypothetical protein [Clostridia bacterium]